MKTKFDSFIAVANTHIQRLQFALEQLRPIVPVNASFIKNINTQDFMYFEVLTSRFSKLQDFVGKQLIDLYLEAQKEDTNGLSMLDKINKLEKLSVIDSTDFWDKLRQLRNHLAHEYPDQPEITADYLNSTYKLSFQLIQLTQKIISNLT